MRKFVVGDLHGNYLGLMQCLEKVKFNKEEDLLISLGDICDGGRTFINIAVALKAQLLKYDSALYSKYPPKIYLIVTHGIFSAGFSKLSEYFDGIYCTNSYQSIIVDLDKDKWVSENVKQLNVF